MQTAVSPTISTNLSTDIAAIHMLEQVSSEPGSLPLLYIYPGKIDLGLTCNAVPCLCSIHPWIPPSEMDGRIGSEIADSGAHWDSSSIPKA